MIIGIVATARNLAIGKDGKLPWHYSADLKFFKKTTIGSAVVMGSNTWQSIGHPLPDRLNVVLSRSRKIDIPTSVVQLSSVEEVADLAQYLNRDVYIIGGASVFQSFADMIERWIVTDIPVEVEDADIFMPANYLDGFEEIDSHELSDGLHVRILQRAAPVVR